MARARCARIAVGLLFSLLLGGAGAHAADIKILTSTSAVILNADADDDLNTFYVGLGANSSLHTGAVTAADLSGVDLFVIMVPEDAFSAAEESAIADFLAAGGDLLLRGDQDGFAATENGHLNALLSALGSAMSLGTASLDTMGLQDTAPMQILSQPGLTDGVFVVNYGNVNELLGVAPSRELFLTASLSEVWGGFESLGGSNGRIILLADTNVISNVEDTVANDNHVFFANLANIQTQSTAVKILTSTLAGTITGGDADNDLNSFYLEAGVSSSLWPAEVSAESLVGTELLVVMSPDDAFTAPELAAMSGFLDGGGRVLFMGEQEVFGGPENAHINAALLALGSSMALGTSEIDPGLQDTIAGQILAHPYTEGVEVVSYGNTNEVTGIPATAPLDGELLRTKDLSTPFAGVEELATGGVVILVGDLNLLSNIEDEVGNDNHRFFLNLAPPAPIFATPGLGVAAGALLAGLLAALGRWRALRH